MKPVTLEFIHTCPCCDIFSRTLQEIAGKQEGIRLKIYYAGKDFDYLPRYGVITKGTLIVNGQTRYEESLLSPKYIEEIVDAAMHGKA